MRSSVPRSMLGYDLRRLVSEKLPYKPGTKLVVHHENRKLTLDQTLGEQGIEFSVQSKPGAGDLAIEPSKPLFWH